MVANCFLELERSKECLDWIETNKPKIPNEYQALFSGIEIKARKLIKKLELEERKDVKQVELQIIINYFDQRLIEFFYWRMT